MTPGCDRGDHSGAQYDRVGRQAWAIAIAIVHDAVVASDILVAAFARTPSASPEADSALLFDVRSRAIALARDAMASPAGSSETTAERRVLAALPEPQREVLEMALLGRVPAREIARHTGIPPADVIALLRGALGVVTSARVRDLPEREPPHLVPDAVVPPTTRGRAPWPQSG